MKLSLNVGLAWPEIEHFYLVGYQGNTVGKIWFATDKRTGATPWEWHLCIPMALPDNTQGLAQSKEHALQVLANSLHTLLLRTPPERIERAFRLSAAAQLGFSSGEQMELSVEEVIEPVAILPTEAAAIEFASLATAAHAIGEPSARQSQAAKPPAPAQPVSRHVVTMVKKRTPTVRVKTVTFDKGAANGNVPKPVSIMAPAGQLPLVPVTDA
jgi:hypothetical protein